MIRGAPKAPACSAAVHIKSSTAKSVGETRAKRKPLFEEGGLFKPVSSCEREREESQLDSGNLPSA
jgi:hypothetical protein